WPEACRWKRAAGWGASPPPRSLAISARGLRVRYASSPRREDSSARVFHVSLGTFRPRHAEIFLWQRQISLSQVSKLLSCRRRGPGGNHHEKNGLSDCGGGTWHRGLCPDRLCPGL